MDHLIGMGKCAPIQAHVAKLVSEAKIPDTQLEADTRYAIWMELILFLLGYRGPFTPHRKSGKLEEIVRLSCLCFPNGTPIPETHWEIGKSARAETITKLMADLSRIPCTAPRLTRWYTVETSPLVCPWAGHAPTSISVSW